MSGIPRLHSNLPPPAPWWGTAPCPLYWQRLIRVSKHVYTCARLLCAFPERLLPPFPPAKSKIRSLAGVNTSTNESPQISFFCKCCRMRVWDPLLLSLYLWLNANQVWSGVWSGDIAPRSWSLFKIKVEVGHCQQEEAAQQFQRGPVMCHRLLKVTIILSVSGANKGCEQVDTHSVGLCWKNGFGTVLEATNKEAISSVFLPLAL